MDDLKVKEFDKLTRLIEERDSLVEIDKSLVEKLNNSTLSNIIKNSRDEANDLTPEKYKKHFIYASLTLPFLTVLSVLAFILTKHPLALVIAAGLISYYQVTIFPPGLKFFRTIFFSTKNVAKKSANEKDLDRTIVLIEGLIDRLNKEIEEVAKERQIDVSYERPIIPTVEKKRTKIRKLTKKQNTN